MELLRQLVRNRFVRFAGIGLLCLLVVQMPVLGVLHSTGMAAVLANVCGFLLSTFVNFVLQRTFTFGDCARGGWSSLARFVASSVVALGVNTGVFVVFHDWFGAWVLVASAAGAVMGSGVNFVINRVLTFRQEGEVPVRTETEATPSLESVRAAVRGNTLAVFMPAYNEAENLPIVVEGLHVYLTSLELLDFRIIIVDDGSPDDTQAVVCGLQTRFAELELRTHRVNRGYGGALRTGFRSVVGTGMDFWGFLDADRQFAPESLGTLLVARDKRDADMTVGYRIGRKDADSKFRFLLGRAWHLFGKTVVGKKRLTVTDVDCGLKVGRTKALAAFVEKLRGEGAAISPELIARTNLCGQLIVEMGVTHLPRGAGESTGSKPSVMLKSAWSLAKLGIRLRAEKILSKINLKGGRYVDAFASARAGE